MYWVTVFTFPIISLALMIIVFEHNSKKPTIVIISTTIIFMMNLIVFWLYDKMIVLFEKRLDEIVARQLNISYRKQLEMMRSSIISSKSFKHDIRRHIVTMKTLIDDKRYSEINDYIKEMDDAIKSEQMVSNTGNLVLDSVINFEINSSGIESSLIVFTATNIPNEMNIKDYDLTVVISNVVSNALLAVKKISDGKVEIDLQYRKGIFFIRINNDFDGRILLKDDEIITTKQDKENHGYGLKNVKATVDKYDGELKIEYDNRIFRLETMMYEKN
jgi:sensor histidine kinase regulating citrate/malate metabolism